MSSLCSYDVGKRSFEGRRYKEDIKAAHRAMDALFAPYNAYVKEQRRKRKKPWKPRWVLTMGNHSNRIVRATEDDAKLEGTISLSDLKYEEYGWEVYPFLQPVIIDNIAFAHYFVSGIMGRPISSAAALLSKRHMSAVAGHLPGRQISTSQRADGKTLTAIIAGSCYTVDQPFLNYQSNSHWRGIVVIHSQGDGQFTEIFVDLDYLSRNYSSKNAWKRKG